MMPTSDRPIYFADDIDSFRETLHNCGLTEVNILLVISKSNMIVKRKINQKWLWGKYGTEC